MRNELRETKINLSFSSSSISHNVYIAGTSFSVAIFV